MLSQCPAYKGSINHMSRFKSVSITDVSPIPLFLCLCFPQKKLEKTHSSRTQRGDSVQPPGLSHRWSHGGSAAGWRARPVVCRAGAEWNKHRNETHRLWYCLSCTLMNSYTGRRILINSSVWFHHELNSPEVFSSTYNNHTDMKI